MTEKKWVLPSENDPRLVEAVIRNGLMESHSCNCKDYKKEAIDYYFPVIILFFIFKFFYDRWFGRI